VISVLLATACTIQLDHDVELLSTPPPLLIHQTSPVGSDCPFTVVTDRFKPWQQQDGAGRCVLLPEADTLMLLLPLLPVHFFY
jgi:hypothetical protein